MKSTLLKSSLIVPALGLFVLGGVVTSNAFADETNDTNKPSRGFFKGQHIELSDEQKATLEEAKALRESGDVEGAQALIESADLPFKPHPFMGDGERSERPELTDEQKAALEQAKTLREAGDEDGAKALLESAGISFPIGGHGKFHGPRMGMGEGFPELTDDQKTVMEEARALHEAGDHEGAKALLEEAGFSMPPFGPHRGS